MNYIHNPILKGFNPDPSIIRIDEDYYIATSTFEWWPGVQIHHSKDLKNWELHSRPLNRVSQLDMTGVCNGGGIWAPCMTYDNGIIYLVYTNVKGSGVFFQADNFLVTTDNINGDWSEPIYLNSFGFDPSLFHDEDGKKWLLSLDNHYKQGERFNGLWLQEYDHNKKTLIGKPLKIYDNPKSELVEGSHIYKRNGYYYLLKAQGGTALEHSAQLARSVNLFGPYEDCPNIILHSRDNLSLKLQKSGHADIVDTTNGDLFMVHLSTSWTCDKAISTIGRETSIQKVEWTDDGWLKLSQGGENPFVEVPCDIPEHKFENNSTFYDFKDGLHRDFQTLRMPIDDLLKFDNNGLTMIGSEAPNSLYKQSLIARRLDNPRATITTAVDFNPEWEKHLAGLICIYNTSHWYYLHITRNTHTKQKEINVIKCDGGKFEFVLDKPVEAFDNKIIYLKAEIDGEKLQFMYNYENENGVKVGNVQDMNILSDEHVPGFTGTMVGICCQDLHLKKKTANFKFFNYEA